MVLNIIVIVALLVVTGFWAAANMKGRGAFSALLAMVATIASGAIAFGLWEPLLLNLFMPLAGTDGTIARLTEATMFGLSLLLPFIVSMVVFRLAFDLLIPANMPTPAVADFVGGALFGAVNACITVGIVVVALGMMRFGPNMGFFNYDALDDEAGPLVYERSLWLPVDRATVAFYDYLSLTTLGTSTPLALEYPRFHEFAATLRKTYADSGLARIGLSPDDVEITGGYRIEGSLRDLQEDAFSDREVTPRLPTGDTYAEGATLVGLTLRFGPGAVDSAQIVLGPGQLRLITDNGQTGSNRETQAVHPYAFIARPSLGGELMQVYQQAGAVMPYMRYKVDTANWFIGSVGADTSQFFIAEFFVPAGHRPKTLIVKGLPIDIEADVITDFDDLMQTPEVRQFLSEARAFGGADEDTFSPAVIRDIGLLSGFLFDAVGLPAATGIGDLVAQGYDIADAPAGDPRESGATTRNGLPNRFALTRNMQGGLSSNEEREITAGEEVFIRDQLDATGVDREMRIESFSETTTAKIMQLQIHGDDGDLTPIGEAIADMAANQIPSLVTNSGQTFRPLGFISVTDDDVRIRYTPDRPMSSLSELPYIPSRRTRDARVWLIYRVTAGAPVAGIVTDDKVAHFLFQPPIEARTR